MLAKCCFRSGNTAIKTHRKPLGCVFKLVTVRSSELHEIQRIENSVEEKSVSIEKFGENDINLWLHSLRPFTLFVTFAMNPFPLPKRCTF